MAKIAFQWGGMALILGAAVLGMAIILVALKPATKEVVITPGASMLMLAASILLLLSLPAMYARQADATGWLGLAGFGLLQTGILLLVVVAATPILYPSLNLASGENLVVFLLGIALTLGLLLTGIATVRAGVFPRWAGILLLAAMAGFFFDFFIAEFLPPAAGQVGSALFGVLLALSLAWIGASLWMGSLGAAIGNTIPAP